MDSFFTINIYDLKIALQNSLNPFDNNIRIKANNFLFTLKSYPDEYCLKLIEILLESINEIYNEVLIQNSSIQLKNIICDNIYGNLREETINNVQKNIFILLSNAKSKVEMKNYQIIIYKILKCGKNWDKFIENVINLITETNNFYHSYCGIEIFYLFGKANELVIEREIYDSFYKKFHNFILNILEILGKNYNINKNDELYNKYVRKIFKIYIKTIVFSPPNEFLIDSKKIIYLALNYPKDNHKTNVIISKFLLKVYEKFFNFKYCDKEDKSYKYFSQFENDQLIFEDFFNYFSSFCVNCEEELNFTICDIYEFYCLSLIRKNNIIINYILKNFENIIIFSIRNNIIRKPLIFVEKDIVYELIDLLDSNPRKYIFNFLLKLINEKNIDSVINIIFNQISYINFLNVNKNLFIESGISILYQLLKKTKSKKKNYFIIEILGKIIIPQLNLKDCNLLECKKLLLFQSFNFLNLIEKIPNLEDNQINFLINKINHGLIYKHSILVNVICAFTLPSIIKYSEKTIIFFKEKLQNIFSIYLKIIKDIDIEELLWSLNSIISIYKNESINYIVFLSTELTQIFFQYINILKDSNLESKTTLDESSCGIIDNLILFFEILINNNDIEKYNNLLQITDNLISFGLSEDCSKASMIIYQNVLTLVNLIVEKGNINNILIWNYYDKIINSIIKKENNEIKQNFAFENLPNIINILYLYIIKGKTKFLEYINSTFIIIQNTIVLCLNINDETFCCCCLKLLISIFETYYNDKNQLVNNLINPLLSFISNELLKTQLITYNQFLIQLLASIISYDSLLSLKFLQENNKLEEILNKWNNNISSMRYDFEYKRSIIGIFSLFLIDSNNMPNKIKILLNSLIKKGFELIKKYDIIVNNKSKKNKKEEEAECIDNDISLEEEEEKEEDDEEWLDDDLENYSEGSDEDYIIEDRKSLEKTFLEKENLYSILFLILTNLKQHFSQEHQNFIFNIIGNENILFLNNKFNLLNK